MNLKNKLKRSWKNPIENKEFTKKSFLTFKSKESKNISLKLYLGTVFSFCLVFAVTIVAFINKPIVDNITSNNETVERLPKPNSQFTISFGTLNYNSPSLTYNHISDLAYDNIDLLQMRSDFSSWFNSMNLAKANVNYRSIKLNDYVANLQPVEVTLLNDKYSIYFSDQDYVIISYKDYFVFYDLLNADKLLEQFLKNQ